MKKLLVPALAVILVLSFFAACKSKPKDVPVPPQVKEQPKVEKVEPAPVKPELTEEEVFMQKSLDQINREKPLTAVYFDYDKYFIREDAKPGLETNAAWMKKWKTVKILVEGHCDERGTEEYNLALGEKRAKSALDYLATLGVPGDRMKMISYGKSQPIDPGHDEAAWQKNRRAQFTIIEK